MALSKVNPSLVQNFGRRNLLINGDFQVNQRGDGSGVGTNAGYVGVDRWRAYISTSSTVNFVQQTFANGHSDVDRNLRHYLKFDWLGTGAAQTKTLSQHIEDVNTGNGQKVTVSFWGRTEQGDDCVLKLYQVFGSGGSSTVEHASGTIDLTTSWKYFTHTFDVTSTSGKTTGAGNKLSLEFVFGPATLNSYFEVAGVQLELGDTATDFEHRTYEDQLADCQKYYYQISGTDRLVGYAFAWNTSEVNVELQLPQVLRGSPTLGFSNGTNHFVFSPYDAYFSTFTAGQFWASDIGMRINLYKSGGGFSSSITQGKSGYVRLMHATAKITVDAEL